MPVIHVVYACHLNQWRAAGISEGARNFFSIW